jgi:transcriptional regulator with XRE-family HTH domain
MPDTGAELAEVSDLDEAEAMALGREIASSVQNVYELLEKAKAGRAWLALDLPDLKSFLILHLDTDHLKIPAGERKALFKSLTGEGLNYREIAEVTGVSTGTISGTLNPVTKSTETLFKIEQSAPVAPAASDPNGSVHLDADPRRVELFPLAIASEVKGEEERAERKKDEVATATVIPATLQQVRAFFVKLDRARVVRVTPDNLADLEEIRAVIDSFLARARP